MEDTPFALPCPFCGKNHFVGRISSIKRYDVETGEGIMSDLRWVVWVQCSKEDVKAYIELELWNKRFSPDNSL